MCFFHAIQANSLSRGTNWLSWLYVLLDTNQCKYRASRYLSGVWGILCIPQSKCCLGFCDKVGSFFLLNWIKREKESTKKKDQIRAGSSSYLMWSLVKRRTYSLVVCFSLRQTVGCPQRDMHILADVNPSVTSERESLSKPAQGSVSPFLASSLDA